jgi:hypothetical protein
MYYFIFLLLFLIILGSIGYFLIIYDDIQFEEELKNALEHHALKSCNTKLEIIGIEKNWYLFSRGARWTAKTNKTNNFDGEFIKGVVTLKNSCEKEKYLILNRREERFYSGISTSFPKGWKPYYPISTFEKGVYKLILVAGTVLTVILIYFYIFLRRKIGDKT